MNKAELEKQVKELKELKIMAEELQAEIATIEDSIKAEMTAQNVNELQVGIFKIRWTPVTSNRFDTKTFKEKYLDLYNQLTKAIETKRFSIAEAGRKPQKPQNKSHSPKRDGGGGTMQKNI